jgi:hypothetical protein
MMATLGDHGQQFSNSLFLSNHSWDQLQPACMTMALFNEVWSTLALKNVFFRLGCNMCIQWALQLRLGSETRLLL